VSTPYAGSSPYPYPSAVPPAPPARKRPSAWWFGVGSILLVIAAGALGVAGGIVVHFFVSADTSFPMQGVHRVHLPAHTERMVFSDGETEQAMCTAQEVHGRQIVFRPFGNESPPERDVSDFARFDTGTGDLVFRCAGSPTDTLWITAVPDVSSIVWLALLGVVVPFLVGGIGVVVLLVTTVLWFTRRPAAPAYPVPPPGPPTV